MTNLETVKAMYAAFGRGDLPFILAQLDPDVSWEFEGPAEMALAGMRRGPAEVVGFFEGILKEHAEPVLEPQHFLADGDQVATFGRYTVILKATGQRVSSPYAHYWTFRNGKAVRYVNFLNTAAFVPAPVAA